jgi:hypothetical protein
MKKPVYYFDNGQIPEIDEIISNAIKVANMKQPWVCAHLGPNAIGPIMCLQHPRAGLMCRRCLEEHIERHDVHVERTCDVCGAEVEMIHAVTNRSVARRVVLRRPRGPKWIYSGPVLTIGAGLCGPCAERLVGVA